LRLRPDAAEPGDILHLDGRVLGRHEGVLHYTIGQRRGLGISDAEPLYVVSVNAAKRQVVVGPREALKRNDIRISRLNWLGEQNLTDVDQPVFAKIRSTRPPVAAILRGGPEGAVVSIAAGEYGVSPGQACVLYDGMGAGARVLGGGFIASAVEPVRGN
jgi:tRNA-specific 2-thiouridylase